MTSFAQPLTLTRGPAMANRFMLAPLTNLQSNPDGTLSDDEIGWLVKRAEGGFATVMTAAAHVQAVGQSRPQPQRLVTSVTAASKAGGPWAPAQRR